MILFFGKCMFDKIKDKVNLKNYYSEHKYEKIFKYFLSAIPTIFILPFSGVIETPTLSNIIFSGVFSAISFYVVHKWYDHSTHAKLFQQEVLHHINDDASELMKKEYYNVFQKLMLYYALATYKKNFNHPPKCEKMTDEAYAQQIIGFEMQIATEMEQTYLKLQDLIDNNKAISVELLATCLRRHNLLESNGMLALIQKEYPNISDQELIIKIKENEKYPYSFQAIEKLTASNKEELKEEKVNELFKTMKNNQYLKTSL